MKILTLVYNTVNPRYKVVQITWQFKRYVTLPRGERGKQSVTAYPYCTMAKSVTERGV